MGDINHSERSHARLSPSASERWLNCHKSIHLEEYIAEFLPQEQESIYAQEGTMAHELAELLLKKECGLEVDESKIKEHDEIMINFCQSYVDYIKDVYNQCKEPQIGIEVAIDISEFAPDCFGTVDCVITDISGKHLQVIDLKYGKGVRVDCKNNTQLQLYSLGILSSLRKQNIEIDKVTMHIVQPRLDSFGSWTISAKELLTKGYDYFLPNANKAFSGEGNTLVGSWCRWCKASGICKARAKHFYTEKSFIDNLEDELISDEVIAETLKATEDLIKWREQLEKITLEKLKKGIDINGITLGKGRSQRKYKDEEELINLLQTELGDISNISNVKLLTITDMKKVLNKDYFTKYIEPNLIKTEPKDVIKFIESESE